MDRPGMVSRLHTPDYGGSYYRLREDVKDAIILPPIYRRAKVGSLYDMDDMDDMDTDPVPPTRGRLATALRWTAYGLRHGCRHVGVYGLHAR